MPKVCFVEEVVFGAPTAGFEEESERKRRGESRVWKRHWSSEIPTKHLAASLCFIQGQMYLRGRARSCTCSWMVQKHCYTTRSRTEVQQEFLGLKAAGWHPCLFYCSTLYLPIKFRASLIDLLVSSHSYLPPLVCVKTSIALRFITLFAFTFFFFFRL